MSTSADLPVLGCQGCAPRGKWCAGCPREVPTGALDNHCVDAKITSKSQVVIVTEAAVYPKMANSGTMHNRGRDDAGMMINSAVKNANEHLGTNLSVQLTHAVLCSGVDPKKTVIDHCKNYLIEGLASYTDPKSPPVIVAMGVNAAKALGIKTESLKEMQSRIIPNAMEINGVYYTVIITISAKMLVAKPGVYNIFFNDLLHAFRVAAGVKFDQVPLEELTKEYRYPKTIDEVRQLCDDIIAYTEDNVPSGKWAIACDTETNTLFAHLDKLKVLGVSFSWSPGKACFIPLQHAETPYDFQQALFHVKRVFACEKPKIFHNGKYDLKVCRKAGIEVVNYAWDTLTGEHVLFEDKSGQYGLKPLTRNRFPQFAGYADQLHALQVKAEGGESQTDALRSGETENNVESHQAVLDIFKPAPKPVKPPKPLKDPTKVRKPRAKKVKTTESGPKGKAGGGGFENIPLKELGMYGAVDADMTRRHSVRQMDALATEQRALDVRRAAAQQSTRRTIPMPVFAKGKAPLRALMRNYVLPATLVLSKMEYTGVKIDRVELRRMATQLAQQMEDTQKEILEITQRAEVNLNRKADVLDILFKTGYTDPATKRFIKHSEEGISKTKTGQLQTTAKVLNWLVANNGCTFSAKKLIYSKASKAKDTFLRSVYDLSSTDGYIHTNFNQHGTCTGRLSSNDTNLQNLPKDLLGIHVKSIFLPDDDSYVFVNADAKNAEIRILAAYCQDKELIKSILAGLDTHCFISEKIVQAIRKEGAQIAKAKLKLLNLDDQYPLTYDDFKEREGRFKSSNYSYYDMLDKFRTAVKRVVFGILYGAGARKIAETIGIQLEQAQALIDMFFALFPAIQAYVTNTQAHLAEFGCVETFFGRRRRFDIKGATNAMKARAQRQGVNFLIQSTSSEIVMGCLAAIDAPLERDFGGRQLLTVHDSLGFQFPKKYLSQLGAFMDEHLEKRTTALYPWMPVPFKWDFEVGPNYGDLTSLKKYLAEEKEIRERNEAREAYNDADIKAILSDINIP